MFIKPLLQWKSLVVKEFSSAIWYSYFNQDKREFPSWKHLTCAQFPVNSRLEPIKGITTEVTVKACLTMALWRSWRRGRGRLMRESNAKGTRSEHKSEMSRKNSWKRQHHDCLSLISCTEINSPSLKSSSCSANSSELHILFVVKAETYSGSSSKTVKTRSILDNLTWPNLDDYVL